MSRLLALMLVLFSVTCYADVATEPWPEKLGDFTSPKPLVVQGFTITERDSPDQEGAGTGGGMCDVVVQNTHTGAKLRLHEQSVGFAALAFYHGWPQLEVWGRAGGGSWSRSLYRVVGRGYKYVRTDEFTEFDFNAKDKTRTTTMPGSKDVLYYVETRLP